MMILSDNIISLYCIYGKKCNNNEETCLSLVHMYMLQNSACPIGNLACNTTITMNSAGLLAGA